MDDNGGDFLVDGRSRSVANGTTVWFQFDEQRQQHFRKAKNYEYFNC